MADTDRESLLARKKKIRAAHRGSTTKIIERVNESLRLPEGPNIPKLTLYRSALSEKLELLMKLDSELIDLVADDELEHEVEQADQVRERINLAMLEIDDATATKRAGTTTTEGSRIALEDLSVHDSSTDAATAVSPPHPDEAGETRTATARPTDTPNEPLPSSSLPVPISHPPSPSPISPSPISHPPSPILSTRVPSPRVKLPKLSLKKFGGDMTKWVTFWDCFDSAVHSNPSLSDVDKFTYLFSLLESSAAEAISGLTLTSANYQEAITTLKKRFGNTQLIVNRHMDALLHLQPVASHHDLKGLRHLYDTVESHVRGLRALGVSADSYGGLLTSILMNKLPPDIRLVVSRELTEASWEIDEMLKVVDREVDARERSATPSTRRLPQKPPTPTGAALYTASSSSDQCVFCQQKHQSLLCHTVVGADARRNALRRSGRCFICLRWHHISRDCQSRLTGAHCRGRHHAAICPQPRSHDTIPSQPHVHVHEDTHSGASPQNHTNTMYVDAHTQVLLQTAVLQLLNPTVSPSTQVQVRAILDSGSQRTYVTSRTREALQLATKWTERLSIKTFGSAEGHDTECAVVELDLLAKSGERLGLSALVVPFICPPMTSQPVSLCRERHKHLLELDLADTADAGDQHAYRVRLLLDSGHRQNTERKKWSNGNTH